MPHSSQSAHNAVTMTPAMVMLFAFCCGAIVANIYYAQPIIELIAPDIGLSSTAASLIVSLTQIGYALGLFFLVPLGDLLENRRLMLVTTVVAILSLLGAAFAEQPNVFLLVSLLVGFSSVSVQMLIPLAAHLAPEESRGRVVGGIMGGLLLGILLARPIASLVADHFGWRAVFGSAAVVMIGISVVLATTMPKRLPDHRASYGQLLFSLWTLLRTQPVLRQRAFYQACMFATFSLFWTAVPLELSRNHGLSQTQIALFALIGAIGAIAAPISGRLADAGYTRIASLGALLFGALSFLPGLVHPAYSVIGLAITGVVLDFCVQTSMVLGQRTVYALDAASRSRLNALYMTSIFIGGAIGSAVASPLFDHGGWTWVLIAGTALPLIALLALLRDRSRQNA
ncbi:MFS transporter [Pseudomonas syringae pv. aptata]|jgi:predicted MFS family arabinose efflux permease|uniref:MFS transporter n=1 Tax=Pseudomonas TaxID=286 RepID=UPI0002ADC897|nr:MULTISPECIES: MFS transporter [Pseudomonas]ELS42460.1 Major facilitator superfamily (MFS) transporter [Pseudomonas syringae pv. syringae B64]EPF67184.1 Major facilitator superfamily transporter [Pseudomonas syringae pv. syringae SM]KTC06719.1 MFS transporter [Pseudomonas syringae ICMP 11168]MBP1121644.1 putative MFS family arabinose efflux permease [Pseudomonas sp. PvP028]MBP1139926.1 putative MFS family arabinose efflux permease [Pseudomonas sp. PvP009]